MEFVELLVARFPLLLFLDKNEASRLKIRCVYLYVDITRKDTKIALNITYKLEMLPWRV